MALGWLAQTELGKGKAGCSISKLKEEWAAGVLPSMTHLS